MRTLADWLAHQQAQHPKEIELGLERVRAVAQRLGVLPWSLPSVLVAGTNGKGSTVAFLTALARASGFSVGTYTSPHLQRYNERVTLNDEPVDDARLVAAFERIEAVRGDTPLTYFEYGTLAAFLIFLEAKVDVAVIEVGLGGRLDATNLIDADVSVITSIGLDHQDWLGPTREHIGREKAGILRRDRPAILGAADIPQSIFDVASEIGAPLQQYGRDFAVEFSAGELGSAFWRWRGYGPLPAPALAGSIQYANAATALAAFDALLLARTELAPTPAWGPTVMGEALTRVRLAGRFERRAASASEPEWILDVAHNEDSARTLAAALAAEPRRRTLGVVGILADKDAHTIGALLSSQIDEWVLCGVAGPRGGEAEDLRARLPADCRSVALVADVREGCATARALAGPQDRIVVFGSFLVVGPAREWLGL
ncbi:MAG: bifunctional tetrahydrofolate synthase/dihydrofolate synthase [Steroidobacteraceae bacterium]